MQKIYEKLPVFLQNKLCSYHGKRILKSRYDSEFRNLLEWLKDSQWWNYYKQIDYQNECLRKLVSHCYDNVPYYNSLMKNRGLKVSDIQTVNDLGKLPILTKENVRNAGDSIFAANLNKSDLISKHTSGTTGAGLQFKETRFTNHYQWAIWWRHRSRFGLNLGDCHANFSGRMAVPLKQTTPPFWRFVKPLNQYYFSVYHLKPEFLESYIEFFENTDLKFFAGYPSAIYVLAEQLASVGYKLKNSPQWVVTGAETVLPYHEPAFQKWLGAGVADQYGQAEGCANISHCEKKKYHVDMEFAIVELIEVDSTDDGKICKIVGTSLHNHAVPFLRYDTGDMAIVKPDEVCECGRQSPVVERIDGRIENYIITPDGRKIGRLACLKDMVNIRECQIIQTELESIDINVVKRDSYSKKDEQLLLTKLAERLGGSIKININYVQSVKRSRTGKFRLVISDIADEYIRNINQLENYQ